MSKRCRHPSSYATMSAAVSKVMRSTSRANACPIAATAARPLSIAGRRLECGSRALSREPACYPSDRRWHVDGPSRRPASQTRPAS